VWVSGHKAVSVPSARLHHRGAAAVNPKGGKAVQELRTSDTKRFFANRNGLLLLLKNAQQYFAGHGVPAIAAAGHRGLGGVDDCASLVIHPASLRAGGGRLLALRHHVAKERRRLRAYRRRSDWRMLRFCGGVSTVWANWPMSNASIAAGVG